MRRRHVLRLTGHAATGLALAAVAGADRAAAAQPYGNGLSEALVHGLPAVRGHVDRSSLVRAVATARGELADGRYAELVDALPFRLSLANAIGGEESHRALAVLYGIAARTATKLGEDTLVLVTADRALTHARESGDSLAIADARRMVSLAYRRNGQPGRALAVAVRAADELGAVRDIAAQPRLSALAQLHATAAYTASRGGDATAARDLMAAARSRAAGVRYGSDGFDARQAALYEVSVLQRAGDPAAAVATARRIDVRGLGAERTARLCIDVARAHADWGRPRQCYAALLAAERAAPQEVRRGVVRGLTRDLLRHRIAGVTGFARRTGAVQANVAR